MGSRRYAQIVYADYNSGLTSLIVHEVSDSGRRIEGMVESPVFDLGSLTKNKNAARAWASERNLYQLNGRRYDS